LKESYLRSHLISILIIILLAWFALSTNVIEVITPLVLVGNGINELWIGIFISIISWISIFASALFGKFIDYKYYKITYVLAACAYLFLIILLLIVPSHLHFTIFITSLALLYIFMDIPVVVFASNYIHEIQWYEGLKSEYILLREIAGNTWRILIFIPIFFMSSFNLENLSFIFILMACSIWISTVLFLKLPIPKIK